jgi:hypothetical protein
VKTIESIIFIFLNNLLIMLFLTIFYDFWGYILIKDGKGERGKL